jgi:hypothetical protein
MEDDCIFYGHLVHFTVFCHILWAYFEVIFPRFGILYQENLATLVRAQPNCFINIQVYTQRQLERITLRLYCLRMPLQLKK